MKICVPLDVQVFNDVNAVYRLTVFAQTTTAVDREGDLQDVQLIKH